MRTRTRNTIKVLPLFALLMAFAIAGIGVKSAAEWPPATCKGNAISRNSILWTQVQGTVSAVRKEVVLPGYRLRNPE